MAKPIVPVVVIGPPVRPLLVATEDTDAFEVLQVPDPVIAPVPLPVRQPVRVAAPVPPLDTASALVSAKVAAFILVALKAVLDPKVKLSLFSELFH